MLKVTRVKIIFILLFMFIAIFLVVGFNASLVITNYTYQDSKLPAEFEGYRIVFLSDFHCKPFGKQQEALIEKITECKPDLIVFTGDMMDSEHNDLTQVSNLLSGIKDLCPIYAISGNHEFDDWKLFQQLKDIYLKYGVTFLDDKYVTISKDKASIGLYGARYQGQYYTNEIKAHTATNTKFNILLAHDASSFQATSQFGYNLILSGHTHGGIIRLPFIGGLINNDGSLLAEYESGSYQLNGSTLISNRGLGDSVLPRFFNRPEVVCITLEQFR